MTQPIHDSWTIARSGILTHQHRLAVTANNIANVDTPGYSRRVARLAPVPETPTSLTESRTWSHGAGVRVVDIVRTENAMTTTMLRQQVGDAAGHRQQADALGGLEALLREDGESSLGARLDAFWNAWSDLANQADNVGFRSVVIQSGVSLATHLQSLNGRIDSFDEQIITGTPGTFTGLLPSDVEEFNRMTEELQDLNKRISFGYGSAEPHALMDRRDVLLQDLSAMANIQVGLDYAVTLDGQTVVSADGADRFTLDISDAGPPPLFEIGGVGVAVTSGNIGAWSSVLDISASLRDRLDTLAADLADAVNSIHNSDRRATGDSYDLDGQRCDWDFFTGTTAGDISVNTLIYDPDNPMDMQPWRIAAAGSIFDDGTGTTGPNRGDGARALEIAMLADATRAALNGQGFGDYHATGLTLLGGVIATEGELADDGDAIVDALKDALQSEVGVNMDEELMDMMSAQRAFQAASRLLQTVDEMLQTILGF